MRLHSTCKWRFLLIPACMRAKRCFCVWTVYSVQLCIVLVLVYQKLSAADISKHHTGSKSGPVDINKSFIYFSPFLIMHNSKTIGHMWMFYMSNNWSFTNDRSFLIKNYMWASKDNLWPKCVLQMLFYLPFYAYLILPHPSHSYIVMLENLVTIPWREQMAEAITTFLNTKC